MEFLTEFVMELLGEILIDAGVDAASDHRRPRWQRVLILSLVVLFFAAVLVLITAAGIILLTGDRPIAGAVMLVLDAALIVCSVRSLRKILRTFSRK